MSERGDDDDGAGARTDDQTVRGETEESLWIGISGGIRSCTSSNNNNTFIYIAQYP